MFKKISQALTSILQKWTDAPLSAEAIAPLLSEIHTALIDADTAIAAADFFIASLKKNIVELRIDKKIEKNQQIQAWVHQALVATLGQAPHPIMHFPTAGPHTIMLVGLQGAGKTTTAVKVAVWMTQTLHKKVAVTSVDFQRPAAQEQLRILAEGANIPYLHSTQSSPMALRDALMQSVKNNHLDTIIIDTAGRLAIDAPMMHELTLLKDTFTPHDIFYVVDSQTGQDAAASAQYFNEKLSFGASILTKCDAESKGGVALSLKTLTGKPIAFVGEGEKTDHLHIFDAQKIANRMLDLGDVAALVATIRKNIDTQEALQQSKKIARGHYDLGDFLEQINQLQSMGGIQEIMKMLPGANIIPTHMQAMMDDKKPKVIAALIQSMTPKERRHPALLDQISRRNRVLKGSGRSKKELTDTLKEFEKIKVFFKKTSMTHMRHMLENFKHTGPKE